MITRPSENEAKERSKHGGQLNNLLNDGVTTDDIDLRQVFITVWKGRWPILSVTAISALASVVVALWQPTEYKATAILISASESGTASLSRIAGQFGGLASLAGINLTGNSDGDKTIAAIEVLNSWDFQEEFIRKNHLEADVFAANGWERKSNQLTFNSRIYDDKEKRWVRRFNPENGEKAEPGGLELYERFSKNFSVNQDQKTKLISISVEYYSPYLAKTWVDKIVSSVNERLRERDRIEAVKSIEYLQAKMAQTSLTEMKAIFSRLIEEQTKNLMLTDVNDEYVLRTLIPAKVPEKPSGPRRLMICLIGTIGGGFLSVLAWLVWSATKIRQLDTQR